MQGWQSLNGSKTTLKIVLQYWMFVFYLQGSNHVTSILAKRFRLWAIIIVFYSSITDNVLDRMQTSRIGKNVRHVSDIGQRGEIAHGVTNNTRPKTRYRSCHFRGYG